MALENLLLGGNAYPDYYSDEFRNVLEDHMSYFRSSPNTRRLIIDADVALQNEFDFYGLLKTKAIPFHLHWLMLRLLNFHSPMDMTRDLKSILLPDFNEVEIIRNIYKANQSR